MNADRLDAAISEARRFIDKACALQEADDKEAIQLKVWAEKNGRPYLASPDLVSGPASSAVRRASMDLTRTLSELRR